MGILPMSCWISTHGQDAHATPEYVSGKAPDTTRKARVPPGLSHVRGWEILFSLPPANFACQTTKTESRSSGRRLKGITASTMSRRLRRLRIAILTPSSKSWRHWRSFTRTMRHHLPGTWAASRSCNLKTSAILSRCKAWTTRILHQNSWSFWPARENFPGSCY